MTRISRWVGGALAALSVAAAAHAGVTLNSAMIVTFFFGGWLGPVLPPIVWFLLKTFVFVCGYVLLRATLPRPRYDQLDCGDHRRQRERLDP